MSNSTLQTLAMIDQRRTLQIMKMMMTLMMKIRNFMALKILGNAGLLEGFCWAYFGRL